MIPAGTARTAVAIGAPAAGPVDAFTRVRLTSMLLGYFGDFPTFGAHLDLLDARGAWYAEQVMAAWSPTQPDAFFGLVAHVVRTQIPGPAHPDLDAWIAAGQPADPHLAERWAEIRNLKALDGRDRPARRRDAIEPLEDHIEALDAAISTWPPEHWELFLLAYVKLDLTLAHRKITLPPIGT